VVILRCLFKAAPDDGLETQDFPFPFGRQGL